MVPEGVTPIHLDTEVSKRLIPESCASSTASTVAPLAVSLAATLAAVIPKSESLMAAQHGLEPPSDFAKTMVEWTQLGQTPARTALGQRLRLLRAQIVRSGELLSLDDVNEIVSAARRRTGV
jgi:hypothetical protein